MQQINFIFNNIFLNNKEQRNMLTFNVTKVIWKTFRIKFPTQYATVPWWAVI